MRVYFALSIAALVFLSSCHTTNKPSTDSNSNWLESCEKDADCTEKSCVCGMCSDSCQKDSECDRKEGSESICIDPSRRGIASECASEITSQGEGKICLPGCGVDEDCASGYRCLQKACVNTKLLSAEGMLDGPCMANGVCAGTLECNEAFVCVQAEAIREPNTMSDASVEALDASVETIESSTKPEASADASVRVEASNEPDAVTGQGESSVLRPLCGLGEDCDSTSECEGDLSCERNTCKNLWDHPSCDPAAMDRPECDQDDDCDDGFLCHVDGTCIEPGLCDAYGSTIVLGSERIFFYDTYYRVIKSVVKTGNELVNIDVLKDRGEYLHNMKPYRDHVYELNHTDDAEFIRRVPILPGSGDNLADRGSYDYYTSFAIGDRGLFYNFNNHLIRQVIPEYYDVEASQGEEGGRCFDDAKCSGDLVCVDLYCVVDTCGDGTCDTDENPCDCPEDCPVGNGATGDLCCYNNDCSQPPNACLEATCLGYECGEPLMIENCCGNAICETGKTTDNCASDCSSG